MIITHLTVSNQYPTVKLKIEVGKKFPSAGMLGRIALALNVDTPELFIIHTVTFLTNNNKSIERLYQEVLFDFKKFENDYKQFEKLLLIKLSNGSKLIS